MRLAHVPQGRPLLHPETGLFHGRALRRLWIPERIQTMKAKKGNKSTNKAAMATITAQNVALVAAEEFALSMVPLLVAVNEVGGVAAAISILRANGKK
jgi:hypothetical protein